LEEQEEEEYWKEENEERRKQREKKRRMAPEPGGLDLHLPLATPAGQRWCSNRRRMVRR